MILSVSRRTDIPAFYMEWFLNRLSDGKVYVRNPFNFNQVSEVDLSPESIECIVFWTKNPTKIYENLMRLKEYNFYVQTTVNQYDSKIEKNLGDHDKILDSFIKLSKEIGRERMVWRYDPIILSENYDINYHVNKFQSIASKLSGYTDTCKISFLEIYPKIKSNISMLKLIESSDELRVALLKSMINIARKYNINIEMCSSATSYKDIGIISGKCIDDNRIAKIIGNKGNIKKDTGQRKECGCVSSIDIGVYNTCPHMCIYCYANYSEKSVHINNLKHNPKSKLLFGDIRDEDEIKKRKIVKHFDDRQLTIF